MGRRKSEFYIAPSDLLKELQHFKKHDEITEELGLMLIKLAKRYATAKNWSNYTYKDEFIQDAIYRMVEQMSKINLEHPKCNPFAYLTKTCEHVFQAKITKEKRIQTTKEKIQDNFYHEFAIHEGIVLKHNEDYSDEA